MEYRTFIDLLKKSEKDTVDFKIRCEAFERDNITAKAELAKDICALANNGNVTSYIIIGVSDDGKSFKSVTNKNLTDDRLQDFCKKAIYPPPKTKLIRKKWKGAQPAHKGIEFVIIQIGPQPRQIFRINQDFIDYKKGVCYRRNEVWIRRNATSDLATPEEIIRLGNGRHLRDGILEPKRQAERESFERSSIYDKSTLIAESTKQFLKGDGYNLFTPEEGVEYYPLPISFTYRQTRADCLAYKKVGFNVILIYVHNCDNTFTETDLKALQPTRFYNDRYAEWIELPESIRALTRRKIRAIRRIWLKPIIGTVPAERISRVFPHSRRIGTYLHFYRPSFYGSAKEMSLTSSSELLILDKIKSQIDYVETLKQALGEAKSNRATLVKLKKKE